MFEGLTRLVDKILERPKGRVLRLTTDPAGFYRYEAAPGDLRTIAPAAAPRVIQCQNLAELVDLANRRSVFDKHLEDRQMAIFIGDAAAQLVYQTPQRVDHAICPLLKTDEWLWAKDCVGAQTARVSPPRFREVLSTLLANANPDPALVGKVQTMKTAAEREREVSANSGALTTSARAANRVTSEMPELVNKLNLRVYCDRYLTTRYPVDLLIQADTERNEWVLNITEDSWLAANAKARSDAKDIVESGLDVDVECGVFLGHYELDDKCEEVEAVVEAK